MVDRLPWFKDFRAEKEAWRDGNRGGSPRVPGNGAMVPIPGSKLSGNLLDSLGFIRQRPTA